MPKRKKQSPSFVTRQLSPNNTVFVYLRDSGGAEQERSVGDQLIEIKNYCEREGLHIARVFTDAGISGGTDDRPQFQEMISACRQEPPDGLLVWSMARFGRNELDRQFYVADLRRRGIVIRSISQDTPEGPMAGLVEAFNAWKDAEYLRDLSLDVRRGLKASAKVRNHGSVPPVGYKRVMVEIGTHRNGAPRQVQRWAIDEDVAPSVRSAFRMYAEGATVKQVHEKLHLHGHSASYSAMFKNRLYVGIVHTGENERYDPELAIIDRETWEKVEKRRREPIHPRNLSSPLLLSGIVVCGICGYRMTGDRVKTPGKQAWNHYYRCRSSRFANCQASMRAEWLDNLVMDSVLAHLSDEHIAAIVAELESRDESAAIERIDREIAQHNQAIDNLLDLAEMGDKVKDRLQGHQERIKELVKERNERSGRRTGADPQRLRADLEAARAGLLSRETAVARRVLLGLISKVVVSPGKNVNIIYRGF